MIILSSKIIPLIILSSDNTNFFNTNYSRGRPNLRNDMNQVKNLKSLGFTWKRIANLLEVFPDVGLCEIYFQGFFDIAFDSHISSIIRFVVDHVAKLVLFVPVAEADDSLAPTLRSSLLSPLLFLPLVLHGHSLRSVYGTFSLRMRSNQAYFS